MKKISICLIIFITTKTLKAENIFNLIRFSANYGVIDTLTYPTSNLSGVTWTFYIDKPINTLLQDLDELFPGYILSPIYGKDKLRTAGTINIYYGNKITLVLNVKKFHFMNPISEDGTWDIN